MITNLPNQPIRFREENEFNKASCYCATDSYAQLVALTDVPCFQYEGSELMDNGSFNDGLTDWDLITSVQITSVTTLNETSLGACDGTATVNVTGGTAPYTYSTDGVTFQVSNSFSLLCNGNYSIFVKDSNGLIDYTTFGIGTAVNCLSYAGSEVFDVLSLNLIDVKDCEVYNFI